MSERELAVATVVWAEDEVVEAGVEAGRELRSWQAERVRRAARRRARRERRVFMVGLLCKVLGRTAFKKTASGDGAQTRFGGFVHKKFTI
jgi:hypothetical protein